jgi:cobalt-precorrin 5A hydrolase
MIAVGLGCRRDCAVEDIVAAVMAALAQAGRGLDEVSALYAPDVRRDAPALFDAAAHLGKHLEFIATAQLIERSGEALTHSARVQARLGVPSAAETAALVGALFTASGGTRARLLAPRSVAGAATCALAIIEGA